MFCFNTAILWTLVIFKFTLGLADENSGCPFYGCLPSGTFTLSSDIPGVETKTSIKWVTVTSNLAVPRRTRLGCVSCQNAVVCPSDTGYIGVDQSNGKILWRYDNMTAPTLPIMDIYGDMIGTDGRHLIKIDYNGVVEHPIIHLHKSLAPMYSLSIATDGLFLMTSKNGMLIAYGTDGIPEGALQLRDSVEQVNGTFVPITQPVIHGIRAYLLTQFVPDSPVPKNKKYVFGLQRLYAVDIWARMVKIIDPVWYYNFERLNCTPNPTQATTSGTPGEGLLWDGTVLVHNSTVYVSLGPPVAGCRGREDLDLTSDVTATLWAFEDKGNYPNVLFKTTAPISRLSLFDVSFYRTEFSRKSDQRESSRGQALKPHPVTQSITGDPVTQSITGDPVTLWGATRDIITGYDSRNGSVVQVIQISKLLNRTAHITSNVMVARSRDGMSERLVFAMTSPGNDSGAAAPSESNVTLPFVMALNIEKNQVQLLWIVAMVPGTEVVGQIANFVQTGGKEDNLKVKNADLEQSSIKSILVGMAISEKSEHLFAIGNL